MCDLNSRLIIKENVFSWNDLIISIFLCLTIMSHYKSDIYI